MVYLHSLPQTLTNHIHVYSSQSSMNIQRKGHERLADLQGLEEQVCLKKASGIFIPVPQ